MKVKTMKIKGTHNIREISQFSNIKRGTLYRSARLDKMSNKKRNEFINKYNIKTIIDLRTEAEKNEGKAYSCPENVKYYHIPVLNQEFLGITHEKSVKSACFKRSKQLSDDFTATDYMIDMYKSIILDKYSQEQFKKFFDVLLDYKEGGVVFYCNGGKDRTGIASLFILSILGIDENTIIEDYSMSDVCNKRRNLFLSFLITLLIPYKKFKSLLKALLHAKKDYIIETINIIKKEYGSVENYLSIAIGIDSLKQEKIKSLFLN